MIAFQINSINGIKYLFYDTALNKAVEGNNSDIVSILLSVPKIDVNIQSI